MNYWIQMRPHFRKNLVHLHILFKILMSCEYNRLIWSCVPGYVFSLSCADNETWSVHTGCALLLLSGGQTTLWVLHHHNQWQVEPAGVWRPLHKHCLFYFFTAMALRRKAAIQLPWSRYRLRPACLLFYLFICLFIQHWNSGILPSAYVKGIFLILGLSGLQKLQSALQCRPALLINYIKMPDGLN